MGKGGGSQTDRERGRSEEESGFVRWNMEINQWRMKMADLGEKAEQRYDKLVFGSQGVKHISGVSPCCVLQLQGGGGKRIKGRGNKKMIARRLKI